MAFNIVEIIRVDPSSDKLEMKTIKQIIVNGTRIDAYDIEVKDDIHHPSTVKITLPANVKYRIVKD